MSASNPVGQKPAIDVKNYYSFNGKLGVISNKIGQENLKDVPFPLRLLPLDLKPYVIENTNYDVEKGGKRKVKSNILHPNYHTEVVLKYTDRIASDTDASMVIFQGKWYAGAANTLTHVNAKLSNLFYFAEVDADKEVVWSRLKLRGKAAYEFSKARKEAVKSQADLGNFVDEYQFVYTITSVIKTPSAKGDDSFVPVFAWELISEKARIVQIDEDLKLQAVFQEYFASQSAPVVSPVGTANSAFATPQVQPQPAPAAQAAPPPVEAPPVQATPPPPPAPVEDDSLPF